ncbi:MAG TPA: DUF4864 domain-containing protein [Devosiaceae bacterium]|nr:DUF4864 domain-containing protein [Devosiaceae bacterium]
MGRLTRAFRVVLLVLAAGSATLAIAAPAVPPAVPSTGNTIPDPSAWQYVITKQIEAFRVGDAQAAMSYAGAGFKRRFTDPRLFMVTVAAAGYFPIFTSLSHSFGIFTQPDPRTAVQVVELVGPRQQRYEAIYALSKEADGWRVESVGLMQLDGMAV